MNSHTQMHIRNGKGGQVRRQSLRSLGVGGLNMMDVGTEPVVYGE